MWLWCDYVAYLRTTGALILETDPKYVWVDGEAVAPRWRGQMQQMMMKCMAGQRTNGRVRDENVLHADKIRVICDSSWHYMVFHETGKGFT